MNFSGWLSSLLLLGSCATDDASSLLGRAAEATLEEGGSALRHRLPELEPATDLDERDDVVEVLLVAEVAQKRYVEGGMTEVWAYRDGARPGAEASVPGPLIEAKRGDRVVVRLRNELPEATTIHWHGVRLVNVSDGTPSSQLEVPPGGEYRYDFVVRDEGTFWYHPHVHGDQQVERGLHGMLVVHGNTDVHDVDVERNLVLDDIKLEPTGALSMETTPDDVMLGRKGNVVLANGATGTVADVVSGTRERWRIVNAANGRFFHLRLPGHVFRVIGWDGGLLESSYETETLLITPGERYDVLVDVVGEVGGRIALESVHYDRGHGAADLGPQRVFELRLASKARTPPERLHRKLGEPVTLMPPSSATERAFVLNEVAGHHGSETRFTINGASFPSVATLHVRQGDVEVWSFQNESEMDHPMHLHGLFFRVLDVNGVPPLHVGWKDTVNVPAKSKLRLALRYEEPGRWLYHCHILEHGERGMTGEFRILRPSDPMPESPSAPKPTPAPSAPMTPSAPADVDIHAGH